MQKQEKENGSKNAHFFPFSTFLGYLFITGIQWLVIKNILHLNKGQRNDAKNLLITYGVEQIFQH